MHTVHGNMKRILVVVMILSLFSVMVLAEDNRFIREDLPHKQLVGPDGIYMMLTNYNRNISLRNIVGYEQELCVFTPEFKEPIKIFAGGFVTVFVVKNNVITEITSKVPAIPEDGYLVVGHGRAAVGFMVQFKVGDKVSLRDYTPVVANNKYKEVILMPDGSEVPINGWNRGRGADEVIVFNADYADKSYSNEWGFEFAVDVDEVYEIRPIGEANPIEIPKKGFVISSHGNKNALISKVTLGDLVELD